MKGSPAGHGENTLRREHIQVLRAVGDALGVTFQQIQKYENGTNAVASTRISDLCRALEMTPNDLFGVSSKMDGNVSSLSFWTMKIALKLEDASPVMRQAVDAMLNVGPGR